MGKVNGYYFDNFEFSGIDPDEPKDIPYGWDVDVDENGPFIVTDDTSTEVDLDRDIPGFEGTWKALDEIWEPEYLGDR